MIHAARGIFNRLLPDVHIFTDHKAGDKAGKYVLSYTSVSSAEKCFYFFLLTIC